MRGSAGAACGSAQQLTAERLAQQQGQRIFIERALALLLGISHARGLQQRLGLTEVELGRHAAVKAQLAELQGIFARRQGLARDGLQFFVSQHAQVGIGDGGDQADLRGLAAFFAGQVLA